MLRELITAIRTLSILPVPGKGTEDLSSALSWFPVVGALLGGLLYLLALIASSVTDGRWPEGVAAILLLAAVVLTRGLHLDGLADWADAFGGGQDRDHTLAIMKDPGTGAASMGSRATCWAPAVRLPKHASFFYPHASRCK